METQTSLAVQTTLLQGFDGLRNRQLVQHQAGPATFRIRDFLNPRATLGLPHATDTHQRGVPSQGLWSALRGIAMSDCGCHEAVRLESDSSDELSIAPTATARFTTGIHNVGQFNPAGFDKGRPSAVAFAAAGCSLRKIEDLQTINRAAGRTTPSVRTPAIQD
jgi:hypothetical protein